MGAIHNKNGLHLEKTDVTLGFIPLTDCAPLVIAHEKGYFASEGLNVTLSREVSWAGIRDKVGLGILDGAQMLASIPVASRLGVGGPKIDMVSAMVLDLNGNAITVNNQLYNHLYEIDSRSEFSPLIAAQALQCLIEENKRSKRPKLRFGVVYPCSTQSYELRYWLASAGIDPDRDVEIVVIPPPKMVTAMTDGDIHGFCVGEPWNTLAVQQQIGHVVATKYQLWNNSPEKVFAVSESWSKENPATHQALLRALIKACIWLDKKENRRLTAKIISQAAYIALPEETVALSLMGSSLKHHGLPPEKVEDFHVFHRYSANFPWLNHAEWFISQMYRWGQLTTPVNIEETVAAVYKPGLFRIAAAALGIESPSIDRKTEGNLHEKMMLTKSQHIGPNQFLDGQIISVGGIIKYLEKQNLSKADIPALRLINAQKEV
ncbi:CmpA/NrtA family ABC transporter substrate-binding protein [Zhongshania aliphaticivorans]|jgi:nitrate/nitrite transport system substrate-binding protein|uniref:CmpA/NrtA family ABC transporter substrate-binding protein n=1 Tax=Zhongshania aliphaticivorans TaxID=1470434 RepID=UPI0039C9BB59|tara:strand:- start:9449 stop:10747 length:1299 start_codon:yes stop_codon:yes gene_type:complete